ncbi:GNAT family N-acetyltransferase [Nitratireductor sp. GCM10026969]|uniref:GNAT family N-acetyltransferase n=1 Tax=Nitratireductor sp. GCM10026969 TaxID=3252645 RepID=UPI00360DF68D
MTKIASLSRHGAAPVARAATGTVVTAKPASVAALKDYEAFCAGMLYPPTQGPLWARAWLDGREDEGLLLFARQAGRPAMALALETARFGAFRVARFAGGSHANGNFPPLDPGGGTLGKDAVSGLLSAIRTARPDIDLVMLERQRLSFERISNPLLHLPHATSPNVALSADLTGGFEQVLERGGKRKRKKHRAQKRKFEAAGGYRLIEARTGAEVDRLLDTFLAFKHERFLSLGLADVFDAPQVQARWRALFHSACGRETQPFVLHGLEVAGKLRAVTGLSRTPDSVICEFNAFAQDELSSLSPGEFLFYEDILAACSEGLAIYDLSVGDEPYKRLWCDIETRHADTFAGLTVKGHLLAHGLRAMSRVKRAVKAHPALARFARRVYRLVPNSR